MKLLAIDTATSTLSAAIAEDGHIVASFCEDSGKNHSLLLLPRVAKLLQAQKLCLGDMAAFAVTVGPGSFTGLRIGIATVKAWAEALNKPFIAVSSLDAMAMALGNSGYVAPIFDARRNEVYTALYLHGKRLSADRAVAPAQLAKELLALQAPITFGGDGLKSYREFFAAELGGNFVLPSAGNTLFMAEPAALLADAKAAAGDFIAPAELLPLYLRLSEAEEKRLEAERAHD